MRKVLLVLILILVVVAGVFSQSSGPMDLVVLLDTSTSMSSHYRQTSDYLIGPFLREFLRIGDTFHLISFSHSPRLEISRRMENVGDVEAVIGRLLLMYPLDNQTDLQSAITFSEQYSRNLPGGRPRKIVLVTDGDAPGTQGIVDSSTGRMRSAGIEFQYIKVPVSGTGPSSGRPQAQTATSQASTPVAAVPSTAPATSTAPVTSPSPATTTTPATQTPSTAPATQPSTAPSTSPAASTPTAPATTPSPASPSTQSTTSPGPAAAPQAASSGGFTMPDLPLPLLIALLLLALLLLALLIWFLARRLQSSPNRAMARAAGPVDSSGLMSSYAEEQKKQARPDLAYPPKDIKPLPKDKVYKEEEFISGEGDPVMLNLFVEDQNTAIGRRNIHAVKPGYSFSVGGGKSDFLIFLVNIAPHIADVTYDGKNCTFTPRKPEYFPDLGSQSVHACIGKSIRVMSEKKYELHIRMERYQDPLKVLNKMLRSITVPGEVK